MKGTSHSSWGMLRIIGWILAMKGIQEWECYNYKYKGTEPGNMCCVQEPQVLCGPLRLKFTEGSGERGGAIEADRSLALHAKLRNLDFFFPD